MKDDYWPIIASNFRESKRHKVVTIVRITSLLVVKAICFLGFLSLQNHDRKIAPKSQSLISASFKQHLIISNVIVFCQRKKNNDN